MRLKYLTLQGFKTFAPKTDLHFGEGLTAIVGPNGSGKSNVADAVRWVLGEQSLLQLRAKRTEDLIFAGSFNRAPLGMAEVTITLDNSDHLIPIEFSEVTLTRRAFRTGENEYYLNRSRVRLRDIQEIAAALGQAYTVVGQGLVDAALSLRPEERRELFEEAAEIRGYFVQREDALRRLQKTEENTTRLNDLMTELEPQVRRMERQARQAEDYGTLKAELLEALVGWFGTRWASAVGDHRRAQASLDDAERLVARHKSEGTEAAALLTEARSRVAGHRKHLTELQEARLHAGNRLAEARGALGVFSERIASTLRSIKGYESEKAQLESLQLRLEGELADLQAAQTDNSAEISALQDEERAVASRQLRAEKELAEASRALKEARAERDRIERTRLGLTSRLEEATRRHERSLQQVADAESAQQAAAGALHEHQTAQLQAQLAVDKASETLLAATQRQQEAAVRLRDGQSARKAAEDAARSVTREDDALHSRLARLDAEREAGLFGGVRAVLRAAENDRLEGVRGTVAQLVQVPSKYEAAVEAALGGRLQEVVVEHWENAEAAIALLKDKGEGRATFLPIDTVRVSSLPAVPKAEGVIGAASDLIEYGGDLSRLVSSVFGRTLIVESLSAARGLLKTLPPSAPWTIATLDGEVVRPGGSVTGGSRSRRGEGGESKTVLSRERSRRDLLALLETSAERLREARAKLDRCITAAAERESALNDAEVSLQSARAGHRAATEQLADAGARRERAAKELAWRESLLRDARRNAEEAEGQIAALRVELERSTLSMQPADDAVRAAETQESTLKAGYAEIAAATSEGRTRLAVLLESARNSGARREELAHRIASGLERQVSLAAALRKSSSELDELNRLKSDSEAKIGELTSEIEALEKQIAGANSTSGLLDEAVNEREREASRLNEALLEGETVLTRASVRCEHCLGTLDALWVEIVEELRAASADPPPDIDDEVSQIAMSRQIPDWRALGAGEEGALEAILEQMGLQPLLRQTRDRGEELDVLERRVRQVRARIARIGPVNPLAAEEHRVLTERHGYLACQLNDLTGAADHLKRIIAELDRTMSERFAETFAQVNVAFGHFFSTLFGGGSARLELTDPENVSQAGIEIYAQPPGKRMQPLSALSGGERALTSAALLFALLRVRPVPFCVLDEVDAALDESNVVRFRSALQELGARTQFIVVTHNRGTIEAAGTLYGVSMAGDGTSKLLSLRVEQAEQAAS